MHVVSTLPCPNPTGLLPFEDSNTTRSKLPNPERLQTHPAAPDIHIGHKLATAAKLAKGFLPQYQCSSISASIAPKPRARSTHELCHRSSDYRISQQTFKA
jgi:hypothetical protein